MGVATTEQSVTGAAPSFTYTGAGWTADTALAYCSGGSYRQNATAGQSVTINVPAGKSGILPIIDVPGSPVTVSISVDGGPSYNVTIGIMVTTAAYQYYWFQVALPPIYFANTAVTHTVTITVVSGTLLMDAVEMYDTATAFAVGTLLGFGHSIMYGYNPGTLGQYASPFITEAGRRLGLAVTNNGLSAEDITNGANSASNPQFFSNGSVATPGWVRSQNAGVWHLAQPQYAVILHGRNDTGYSILYDQPPSGNSSNGASALAQVQVLTTGGTTLSGAFTLIDGAASSGMSVLSNQATLQSNLDAAGIPYNIALSASSMSVAGSTATFTAKTPGARPQNLTINTTTPFALTPSNGITVGAPNPAGRAASPAGTGFALARFKQRYLERLWRMNLNSPGTKIFCLGQSHANDTQDVTAWVYNQTIQQCCADPTVRNAYYVDMWDAGNSIGISTFLNTDGVHPTQDGHYAMADALVKAISTAAYPQRGRGRR